MRKLVIQFFCFISVFCLTPLPIKSTEPFSLQQKFIHGHEGDFIVTSQDGHYSLLFIRSLTTDHLLLEEISVPEHQVDIRKIDWKQWAKNKAPGHTSWTLSEIDRKSGTLLECFSFSKNGWLYLDNSEQFLTKLFALPLSLVPDKERKKIGPAPNPGEQDLRALWNPQLVIEGKKIEKPSFDVFKTRWPQDQSRLSLCAIELYFSKQDSQFPFPYWLEVQSPHYTFKMRAIDSGHGLVSSMPGTMPRRPPQILGLTQKTDAEWIIRVRTPAYFQKLHLFARDQNSQGHAAIPIPFTANPGEKPEELILKISFSDLQKFLRQYHRYYWVIIPESSTNIYVESEETFHFP